MKASLQAAPKNTARAVQERAPAARPLLQDETTAERLDIAIDSRPRHDFGRIPVDPGSAPPMVEQVLASRGDPLDAPVRSEMEPRFGHDFGKVRIHSGSAAAESARALDAPAYTLGDSIVWAANCPPASAMGRQILAHELAHVVQQRDARAPGSLEVGARGDSLEAEARRAASDVLAGGHARLSTAAALAIQRFEADEHRDIGKAASSETTTIRYGAGPNDVLTYGEIVALAGDYFESVTEMIQLATDQSDKDGKEQIAWARWDALYRKSAPEPGVPAATKQKVKFRFNLLAAENIPHFGAGGTARESYERYHRRALMTAFQAGYGSDADKWKRAIDIEAFGNHYLTDMFSAGHVRTQRQKIKDVYAQKFPDSGDKIVKYLASRMQSWLKHNLTKEEYTFTTPGIAAELPAGVVAGEIRDVGGPAIQKFTLGDLVSLAYHNKDNEGLEVVSRVDETGAKMVAWRAVGDEHLNSAQGGKTKTMAIAAVKASIVDLHTVYEIGKSAGPLSKSAVDELQKTALMKVQPYAAEEFIPEENGLKKNTEMAWEWGQFNQEMRKAVDSTVKGEIVEKVVSAVEGMGGWKEKALRGVAAELSKQGILAIEAAMGSSAGGLAAAANP
jgi:Domain of unknown function (DUF4157)